MIEAMNGGPPVYAVDLPSGVNGTTGEVMGLAVRATETVTFFRRKPGHVLLPGRLHCGRTHVADIGIPDGVLEGIKPQAFANSVALWGRAFPMPRVGGHKYARGHAVVVSGDVSSTGAARLAARGALRAGAGLVTLASPSDALAVNATASTAVMVRAIDGPVEFREFLHDARRNAVVLGPGGGVGKDMRDLVLVALAGERSVVLDADALTSLHGTAAEPVRGHPEPQCGCRPDAARGRVLPDFHVCPKSLKHPQSWSGCAGRAVASGAVCLLKGSDTVVAAPDGRAAISENAPPWLATAGSGDVLAGLVAGLLAQGMTAFEAAAAAVWLHGEAGTEAGPGLIAEDLPEMMPRIYRRLFAQLEAG